MALDLLDLEPIEGVTFAKLDFLAPEAPGWIIATLGGKADVVLSDMAANTTGHRKTDHLRIMALAEAAAEFAGEILAPGGAFLAKVLQGGHRNRAARFAQARFHTRQACEAGGEPRRFGGALSVGDGISSGNGRGSSVGPGSGRHPASIRSFPHG